MKRFFLALQFLTRVPVRVSDIRAQDMGESIIFFPVIGALLGVILIGIDYVLGLCGFGSLATSTIEVVALIVMTGALHLDGLADTCDALLSGKKREEMLNIMRDPHIGAMGAAGLVSIILLKISLLSSLHGSMRTATLLLFCVLGRWSMVYAMSTAPYARTEGKAKTFLDAVQPWMLPAVSCVTLLLVAAAGQIAGIALFAFATAAAHLMTLYLKRTLGGVTGDTLGATDELIETLTLLLACIIQGIH